MIKISTLLLCAALLAGCSKSGPKDPVDYVNPYIGNISHLLVPTFPTVQLPNSMLRVYPERADYTSPIMPSRTRAPCTGSGSRRGAGRFC